MRIVFMGTPDFAVASLDAMVKAGMDVVGVITAPDKPAGRGKKLRQSPVKEYAVEQNMHLLQPTNLKAPEFVAELQALQADLQVVVAFRMLPEVVWNMPPKGTINLHGSLLPQYRGAAPINRAVMNGETVTGVTTFFLQHKIDTGNIIFKEETPVGPNETAGDVHDRLMEIGAGLIVKTVKAIAAGDYTETPQDSIAPGHIHEAPKIFREDCKIDWNRESTNVWNHIRGLLPYPAPWSALLSPEGETIDVKIHDARPADRKTGSAGTVLVDGNELFVGTANGSIQVLQMQLPGKRKMQVTDLLNGFPIDNRWHFK